MKCGTIMSIHEYIYIYIYIYMCVCVCVCVCGCVCRSVCCGWPAELSSVSLKQRQCLEGPLYPFWRRPHKELCPREPARPEEKDEGHWSVRNETPKQWVRQFEPGARGWSVGSDMCPEKSEGSMESEIGRRAVKTMIRDESASLVAM